MLWSDRRQPSVLRRTDGRCSVVGSDATLRVNILWAHDDLLVIYRGTLLSFPLGHLCFVADDDLLAILKLALELILQVGHFERFFQNLFCGLTLFCVVSCTVWLVWRTKTCSNADVFIEFSYFLLTAIPWIRLRLLWLSLTHLIVFQLRGRFWYKHSVVIFLLFLSRWLCRIVSDFSLFSEFFELLANAFGQSALPKSIEWREVTHVVEALGHLLLSKIEA